MIRPLQMIPACAVVLLCCTVGTPDDETDESNQQALTNLGANVLVSASPGSPQGNETSATWAIVANSTPGLLVSYNSQAAAPWPDGTNTHCAWSRSINSGTSWTSSDDHTTPLPGYNTGSNGSLYRYCLGDTDVAGASGYPPSRRW